MEQRRLSTGYSKVSRVNLKNGKTRWKSINPSTSSLLVFALHGWKRRAKQLSRWRATAWSMSQRDADVRAKRKSHAGERQEIKKPKISD